MSRNPFLQTFEAEFNKQAQLIDMSATMKESPKKATFGDDARDLFVRPCVPVTKRSCGVAPAAAPQHFLPSRSCTRHVSSPSSVRWITSDVLRASLLTTLPWNRITSRSMMATRGAPRLPATNPPAAALSPSRATVRLARTRRNARADETINARADAMTGAMIDRAALPVALPVPLDPRALDETHRRGAARIGGTTAGDRVATQSRP
jgi:hypothetical protein